MNLTARERELIEAFRTERNIYNGALADVLAALAGLFPGADPYTADQLYNDAKKAILALRKED